MRALSAAELLGVWERGQAQRPVEQALALLEAACPDVAPDTLATLSIGQRDACLLTLREWTFGPRLVSLATCPGCGERLELAFDVADIRVAPVAAPAEVLSLTLAEYEVRFRLPNSGDLAAMASADSAATWRQVLDRCILAAHQAGEERPADQLPANVVMEIVEGMAQADPQADVQLALACPDCGREWRTAFDIVSFFWSEINAWALRILREVHTLARAYGWREADILAMSPWRRQCYLEMVGA